MKTAQQYAEEIASELPCNKKRLSAQIEQAILDYAKICKNEENIRLLTNVHHAIIERGGYKFIRIEFKDFVTDISEYSLPLIIAAIKSIGKNPIEITNEELHEAQEKMLRIVAN